LNAVSSTIVSGADPAAGYVIVQIPESPAAPHMIDKIYYGRGDKTKVKLSDAEVLRLHQRRRIAEQDVLDLLNDEITNDPFEGEGQQLWVDVHRLRHRIQAGSRVCRPASINALSSCSLSTASNGPARTLLREPGVGAGRRLYGVGRPPELALSSECFGW